MANEGRGNKLLNFIQNNTVPVAAVIVVLLLFIPMPQILIDVGMIINLAFSILILLVVVTTPRASDFETFPRVILLQTLFGLAINISSTRLILMGKTDATGALQNQSFMVQAFAKVVAGDDIIIGAIIFIILIIVQLVVVTKGASRVSEVAARFSLDSMNQKLFDVNDRLNQGAITPEEAERQKETIRKEIDFYSAMDGSSKFVSGNVKAGIFITLINLIGGFIMGMVRNGMSFQDALNTYSSLTIGDGLTSQLPSIIISFATGILVTGTKSDEPLTDQIKNNFARDGYIYIILGAVLILAGLALRKNTQWLLVPIGGLLIFAGVKISAKKEKAVKNAALAANKEKTAAPVSNSDSGPVMLDPLSLELGYELISLVDKDKGAELLDRIARIRTEARYDMGLEIPKIRIQDNMSIDPNQYSFKIQGIEAGTYKVHVGYLMCMDSGTVINQLEGEKTKDPAFGMNAIWLPESQREEAEAAGYVVVDVPTVISTHITEILRTHASQLLDTEAVSAILNKVKETNPVLVDEIENTAKIPYRTILWVLQNLLDEKVSIRNYKKILETMANYYAGRNVWQLTEKVREALGLQICMQYVDSSEKKLRVMRLSQELSEMIQQFAVYPPDGSRPYVAFDPPGRRRWLNAVSSSLRKITDAGYMPVILCIAQVRFLVRTALEREQPGIVVLSDLEVMAAGNDISIDIVDDIEDEKINTQVN
jgi:flagellar biosynthesis protein FlhA